MMMTKTHIRNLILPLALAMVGGCAHDDDISSRTQGQLDGRYVVLNIALPLRDSSSRSNPMGGEEGNGREAGVLNEDKIHDINVYFYEGDDGLDSSADTPLLSHIYYNIDDPSDANNTALRELTASEKEELGNMGITGKYLQLSFPVMKTDNATDIYSHLKEGLSFVAVANLGYPGETLTTMGSLRDLDFSNYATHEWKNKNVSGTKADKMDYFLMSTGFNKEYYYEGKSTGTNKLLSGPAGYTGTTTLERLYARIDLWYNAEENAGIGSDVADDAVIAKLVYSISGTDNKVYLRNILPVNVMQNPSYLFKKVTKSATAWTQAGLSGVSEFSWAGKESPGTIPVAGTTDLPTNYVVERHTTAKQTDGSTTASYLNSWYGTTTSATVKTDIADPDKGVINGYFNMKRERGEYDPDYDCDRISIISYANENTHPIDCYHSNYLTGLAIRGVYVPAKIYKDYSLVAGTTRYEPVEMTVEEKQGLTSGKIYRYSPVVAGSVEDASCLYFSSESVANAYRAAHPGENGMITDYNVVNDATIGTAGFLCYYNLWIRHYNDESADPQQTYPMEYAIVRNNIYRVALGFSGPGDPTPTLREPDTMQARIFVRKWNLREEEDPLEF